MLCRALASTNPGSGGLCPLGELDVPVGQLIGDVARAGGDSRADQASRSDCIRRP